MTGQTTTTDQPSRSAAGRRTRRQLLAGGTGALAAVLTAEALARPAPAAAADGNPVILGQSNDETSVTTITNDTFAATGLTVNVTGIGGPTAIEANSSAFGVTGSGVNVGVIGSTETGQGVSGVSNGGGLGVYGQSGNTASAVSSGNGVQGITDSGSGAGVFGENASAGGIGVSGTAAGSSGVGVTGNGGSTGVRGTGNIGVLGSAGNAGGTGVYGNADFATSAGVLASNTAGGNALQVSGTAAFSRSGILTIAAGKSSATQTGVPLTSASLVLATMQQDRTGIYIRSAVPNVAGSSFTVHLSKAVSVNTNVAWFVVN